MTLLITKAPFTKIWHIFKAKAIAALEKYVIVLKFALMIPHEGKNQIKIFTLI